MNRGIGIFVKAFFFVVLLGTSMADTGWFWHVTDFHWDFTYWKEQMSCNGMGSKQPGEFGDQWCDAPWRLIEETVWGMRDIKQDVDFVLWTGDSAPHFNVSELSREKNIELMNNITSVLKSSFPDLSILATFGNNDYYPAHQFPPHGNLLYNATREMWNDWSYTYNSTTFIKGGYYTTKISSSLRFVALNTNLYYYKDKATQAISDPAGQFEWLEQILTHATEHNEKVFLTGHIPPGYNTPRGIRWMSSDFNNKFIDTLKRHSDVIVAMHFGHEHHDCFRLLYDDSGRPVGSLFIAPSVTPWRYQLSGETAPAHNPGVRLVKYDRNTGIQLDIVQFYVDLQQVNTERTFKLKLGYNATQLYNIPNLTPASLHELVNRMEDFKSREFKAYVNWYNTNAYNDNFCDENCHRVVMCGFRYLIEDSFSRCVQSIHVKSAHDKTNPTFTIIGSVLVSLLFSLLI